MNAGRWTWCLALVALFASACRAQDGHLNAAFKRLMAGDHDALPVFLESPEQAVAFLVARTAGGSPRAQVAALQALTAVDLADTGVVDRPEVVLALAAAVAPSQSRPDVVDEGLRGLQRLGPGVAVPGNLVEHLLGRAAEGEVRAVAVLGLVGDASLIPVLHVYLGHADPGMVDWAGRALARLGDAQALNAILAELGLDGPARNRAFEKLAYARQQATVAAIAVWLDSPGRPVSADRDVGHPAYREMAAWALGEIVPDPPLRKAAGMLSEADIETWRAWWSTNADRFPPPAR